MSLYETAKGTISRAISDALRVVSKRLLKKEEEVPPLPPKILVTTTAKHGTEEEVVGQQDQEQEQGQYQEVVKNLFFSKRTLCSVQYVLENRRVWYGPTKESNWVIPGRLLAGAYPLSWSVKKDKVSINQMDLFHLLNEGITTFVCLQDEYSHAIPIREQRILSRTKSKKVVRKPSNARLKGKKLMFPYVDEAALMLENAKRCWRSGLEFYHMPIVDLKCTDDDQVFELAYHLAKLLATDPEKKLYVHCWGGHGRTGTIIAVMLSILYSIDAYEALQRTQLYHDSRECKLQVRSPQTDQQCEQVRRILSKPCAELARIELQRKHVEPPNPSAWRVDVESHIMEHLGIEPKRQSAEPNTMVEEDEDENTLREEYESKSGGNDYLTSSFSTTKKKESFRRTPEPPALPRDVVFMGGHLYSPRQRIAEYRKIHL